MKQFKYTKGSKWVVVEDSYLGWYREGNVLTCTQDSDFSLQILLNNKDTRVVSSNFIPYVEPVVDPVANAKLALDNAQKAYDLAVIQAEEATKFTGADIRNFMVVKSKHFAGLRLVTLSNFRYMMTTQEGESVNAGELKDLLNELNTCNIKTNLTLKDFANAN